MTGATGAGQDHNVDPGLPRARLLAATLRSLPLLALPTPGLVLLVAVLAAGQPMASGMVLPLLLLALWQGLLAWRLRLDGELFQLLADGLEPAELDRWLACWLQRPLQWRSLVQREQGTLRLMRRYCWLTGVLWVGTVLALLVLLWQRA